MLERKGRGVSASTIVMSATIKTEKVPDAYLARKPNVIFMSVVGIFTMVSVVAFFWMNSVIVRNSYEYLAHLDYSNTSGKATLGACAALFVYAMYMINYPEGQLASEAASKFKAKSS